MSTELFEIYDANGDFLFSTASNMELYQLLRNATERGYFPEIRKDTEDEHGYEY